MAGAWSCGIAPNVSTGVPRAHTERSRAVRTIRSVEGLRFLWFGSSRYRGVRLVFRPIWSKRAAGSHHHPNSAAAGLLLLVGVRRTVFASVITRDTGDADRTC